MNATDFIKQHGIEKAREVVEDAPEKATVVSAETYGYFYKYQDSPVWGRVYRRKDGDEWSCTRFFPIINPIELSDLKRLIESFDLINSLGGVQEATNKAFDMTMLVVGFNPDKIEQAIADYESIYSNDMGDDSHIENHVSPLCHHHWVDGLDGGTMVCAHECGVWSVEVMRSEFDEWAYNNGMSRTRDEEGYFSKVTQAASDAWQHQQSKVDELQKRVDAALQLVNEMKGKRYPFSAYADQLEQALKGDQ